MKTRFRHIFIGGGAVAVLAALRLTDPDQGLSTGMLLLSIASGLIAVAFAHLARKALHDYPEADARNAVFYGDKAIDRSPCGTGTSARLAQWYAKGKLKPGQDFIHESIIGSKFTGRIEEELQVAGKPAIRPSIEGWAKIYGYNTISIDTTDDPYAHGFIVI